MVMPPEGYSKEEVERLVSRTLTKKMGSPRDVARAVLFFCEATDFATGAILTLEGGRLLV
jgi:pteridine reductase